MKKIYLRNKKIDTIFKWTALFATSIGIIVLVILLTNVFIDGAQRIDMDFIKNLPSRRAHRAGIFIPLVDTIYLMILTIILVLPLGIGAAVYLEEYSKKSKFTKIIEINISNLAGVPSVIYGMLGLSIFVNYLGFGRSLISGAMTLSLLVLPIVIIASREAIRAIPGTLREASLALGATQWQTIWHQILPASMPGILTGAILAISRAIGETAPLIVVGAMSYVAFLPEKLTDEFTAMPMQIYNWISRPQADFHENAAAAILVLLFLMLLLNSVAIFLRHKFQRRIKW